MVDFALAERACCSQFTYAITFGAHGTSIELRVAAPDKLVAPLQRLYAGIGPESTNA